jgi:recombination protein RecA
MLALGEKMGIIKKSGSSYEYNGEKIGRGYDSARQFLKENPKVTAEILKVIREKLKEL